MSAFKGKTGITNATEVNFDLGGVFSPPNPPLRVFPVLCSQWGKERGVGAPLYRITIFV